MISKEFHRKRPTNYKRKKVQTPSLDNQILFKYELYNFIKKFNLMQNLADTEKLIENKSGQRYNQPNHRHKIPQRT